MAEVFDIDQSGIARHIKNILKDEEVATKSNMQKMHIANSDKPIWLYSLDIILAVGYRANSSRTIAFRAVGHQNGQSDPKQKDRMIGLVLLLLGKNYN